MPLKSHSTVKTVKANRQQYVQHQSERYAPFLQYLQEGRMAPEMRWGSYALRWVRLKVLQYTVKQMAKLFGLTRKNIEDLELNNARPSKAMIRRLDRIAKEKSFYPERLRPVQALIRVLHTLDQRTEQHSCRVAAFSEEIARAAGFPPEKLSVIALAAELHDVGKLSIPHEILYKPDRLARREWLRVSEHPTVGEFLLSQWTGFQEISKIVGQHHERMDGRGYPRGLKGEEIMAEARILAVADIFDALTSHRVYRKQQALPLVAAIPIIQNDRGLDKKFVDIVTKLVMTEKITPVFVEEAERMHEGLRGAVTRLADTRIAPDLLEAGFFEPRQKNNVSVVRHRRAADVPVEKTS